MTWLLDYSNICPSLFKRYIYDIFAFLNTFHEVVSFFEYFNSRHPHINLAVETETYKKLPFHEDISEMSTVIKLQVFFTKVQIRNVY